MRQADTSWKLGFAASALGDVRRAKRFHKMLAALSRRPSGKVSEVFRRAADQQAAYDFLEHDTVDANAVQMLAFRETATRCRGHRSVYLVLDGSSLSLTDRTGTKGFGSIGNRGKNGRGLKVMNGLAVSTSGKTLGILSQRFWARGPKPAKGYRPLRDRESYRWHEAFDAAVESMRKWAPETRLHVLSDRESDATQFMRHVVASGCDFTVRANGTRKALVNGRRVLLRPLLKRLPVLARYSFEYAGDGGRSPARIATMAVRAARVRLVVRDHHIKQRHVLELTAVLAREERAPRGVKPLDWLLYTTVPVPNAAAAVAAIARYGYRWRIEDFHRALKSGGGCVEDSQLRSEAAVIKWATLHTMIATRAQRLRDAARTTPDAPASCELSDAEVEARVLLKTTEKRRNETVSGVELTLARAVRWLGDLGGFTATGASTKMPGTTVIARGLERVLDAAQIIEALRASGKMR